MPTALESDYVDQFTTAAQPLPPTNITQLENIVKQELKGSHLHTLLWANFVGDPDKHTVYKLTPEDFRGVFAVLNYITYLTNHVETNH